MAKRILALILFSMLFLSACKASENDAYIQGRWMFEDPHFFGLVGETYATTFWAFSNGTFSVDACCFNIDTYQTGRYRILEDDGDTITIELFNVQGGNANLTIRGEVLILIDREENTLMIQGYGPFIRPGLND